MLPNDLRDIRDYVFMSKPNNFYVSSEENVIFRSTEDNNIMEILLHFPSSESLKSLQIFYFGCTDVSL